MTDVSHRQGPRKGFLAADLLPARRRLPHRVDRCCSQSIGRDRPDKRDNRVPRECHAIFGNPPDPPRRSVRPIDSRSERMRPFPHGRLFLALAPGRSAALHVRRSRIPAPPDRDSANRPGASQARLRFAAELPVVRDGQRLSGRRWVAKGGREGWSEAASMRLRLLQTEGCPPG